jgi:hypothetical protein
MYIAFGGKTVSQKLFPDVVVPEYSPPRNKTMQRSYPFQSNSAVSRQKRGYKGFMIARDQLLICAA